MDRTDNLLDENCDICSRKKIALILIALSIIIIRLMVIERVIVYGESMFPTCQQGDVYMSLKIGVVPKRYDIVIAKIGHQKVIKRVIGLPGDTLTVRQGNVYINGGLVDEKYNFFTDSAGVLDNSYYLEDNCYFLMGDNRNESMDSRTYGGVDIECVEGVIILKIFPFWDRG